MVDGAAAGAGGRVRAELAMAMAFMAFVPVGALECAGMGPIFGGRRATVCADSHAIAAAEAEMPTNRRNRAAGDA
jgi:hypothetical protein